MSEETEDSQTTIPRWTPDFDPSTFDVQAVFREAMLQKKSAGKLLKELGYPVKKFLSQAAVKFSAATEDGLIPMTASSTAIDLSGDDFAESAIEEMQAAAKGSTVFLNHSYTLPEDVYGKIADCSISKRAEFNPVSNQSEDLTCWDLQAAPVGEEENPRAVRVTNMLQKSKLKLGVSVTVIVLKSARRKDGGRTIEHVFYIETSMVGIPCNQTAWAGEGKSKSKSSPADNYRTFTPVNPRDPASVERFREELTEWLQTEPKEGKPMSDEKNLASEQREGKAMFADVLDENQNNFWMYVSSLSTTVNRILRDARGKDDAAQAEAVAEGEESFDEFAAKLKEWFPEEVAEAAAQDAEPDYYWDYYDAVARIRSIVQKAGARNSAADITLLNKMHDLTVELGVGCKALASDDTDEGDDAEANKGVTPSALAEATSKAAQAEAEAKALREERDDLKAQLETAINVADEATKQLELERATSLAAVTALERFGREPLPRAGASVS